MKVTIPIWTARSKNRFHFLERGERLHIRVDPRSGRKHARLVITRQFFNAPSWEDAEQCRFSINRNVLQDLKALIESMEVKMK